MSQQIQITGGAKVRDLQDVIIGTSGVLSSLAFNVANGVPKLDSNGKILVAQLPNSVMEYLGVWNAATNTPTLVNGTGNQGDVYLCNVAGTVDFGAGPIVFFVGDQVIYSGSIWQRASGSTGTVTSVAVTESGDSLNITGSPITTSGTINIGFNGTNLQYVNGAGNLTTFPDLSVYVTLAGTQTITGAKTFGIAKFDGGIYLKDSAITSIISGYTAIGSVTGGIYISLNGSIYQSTLAFNSAADFTYQFPSASGTIALTSDIPILTGYVPYTGATQDVDLGAFKLNAQSLHIKGTGGLGHLGLKHQSASATAAANEVSLFADSLGDLGWLNGNLYLSKFITSGNTAARSYTFPNATCNIPDDSLVVHLAGTETITGAKTFSGGVTFSSSVTTNNLTFANSGFFLTLQPPTLSVNRTVTFADITGTIAMLEGTQTFTGYKTFDAALELKYNVIPTPSSAGNIGIGSNGVGITITTKPVSTVYNNNLYFASASNTFTFPNATGTIALTSDLTGGTVTSVAALTIGTSGTDLSSSVATSTTTPVITLNVPTASATNRGALSSADWTTFNNKQSTISLTTTGTSGAATFSANTLNIPNYGSALSGYLPLSAGASYPLTGNLIIQKTAPNISFKGGYTQDLAFFLNSEPSVYLVDDATATKGIKVNISTGAFNQLGGGAATFTGALSGTSATFSSTGVFGNASLNGAYLVVKGANGVPASSGTTTTAVFRVSSGTGLYNVLDFGTNEALDYSWIQSTRANSLGTYDYLAIQPNGGNLLIGTLTNSTYKLDVNGTGRFSGDLKISGALIGGDASFNIGINYNTGGTPQFAYYGGTTTEKFKVTSTGAATFSSSVTASGNLNLQGAVTRNINFYDSSNTNINAQIQYDQIASNSGQLFFGTNNAGTFATRLTIASTGAATFSSGIGTLGYTGSTSYAALFNGSVGIGTSSPRTKFDVLGSGSQNTAGDALGEAIITGANYNPVSTANGNLFIQTNEAQAANQGGSIAFGARYDGTTAAAGFAMIKGAKENSTSGNLAGYLSFYTRDNALGILERMRITSGGYLKASNSGVYNNATGAYHEMRQTATENNIAILTNTSASPYGPSINFTSASPNNTTNYFLIGADSTTNRFIIYSNGSATFTGSVTATSFFESSDSRLKTLIQDNYQTKGIASITPKLYTKNGKVELGYYAQDFVGILDSAVSKGSDDMLSLSYREVHTAKIYALEQEIKELKAKLN